LISSYLNKDYPNNIGIFWVDDFNWYRKSQVNIGINPVIAIVKFRLKYYDALQV
jgi:hypothetical protein